MVKSDNPSTNILARLYAHVADGNSNAVSTIADILEYPGTIEDIEEDPQPFLDYLHHCFDILDWFETRSLLEDMLNVTFPRLFDERLEAAKTVHDFEQAILPYVEKDDGYQPQDTDDCA